MSLTCLLFLMQRTAYEMRMRAWSADVCYSDLRPSRVFRKSGSAPTARTDGPDLLLASAPVFDQRLAGQQFQAGQRRARLDAQEPVALAEPMRAHASRLEGAKDTMLGLMRTAPANRCSDEQTRPPRHAGVRTP